MLHKKQMLIDSTQREETRVVIMDDNILDVAEYDNENNKQIKGNIYLASISRIEPSLQAVFVDYGGSKHGFLSFSEIHPDYYLLTESERARLTQLIITNNTPDLDEEGNTLPKKPLHPSILYDIYNVLKQNQPLLVQVVKEERGNKGAALTTFISISGRYCIFMPNTYNGSGISRKITSNPDRQRIKAILEELDLPFGVSTIIRTAGEGLAKTEILRDMKYLTRLWKNICIDASKMTQPGVIYEEANLIRRAIRDLFTHDISEIIVEGENGFKQAQSFMKVIAPLYAKRISQYTDTDQPLFHKYAVEEQLISMSNPSVTLPSGGYIVISPTEALVAIDVNSGKATRMNSVEETAYQTNLEAAKEISRQLHLKNLAGLIVIDFIDMQNPNNQKDVETLVKHLTKNDKAKVQVGKISKFGLLELSRQRLRPSIFETNSDVCEHCQGTGFVRSKSSSSLSLLRAIEEEAMKNTHKIINVNVSHKVALHMLNENKQDLMKLEQRFHIKVNLDIDNSLKIHEHAFQYEETEEDNQRQNQPADNYFSNSNRERHYQANHLNQNNQQMNKDITSPSYKYQQSNEVKSLRKGREFLKDNPSRNQMKSFHKDKNPYAGRKNNMTKVDDLSFQQETSQREKCLIQNIISETDEPSKVQRRPYKISGSGFKDNLKSKVIKNIKIEDISNPLPFPDSLESDEHPASHHSPSEDDGIQLDTLETHIIDDNRNLNEFILKDDNNLPSRNQTPVINDILMSDNMDIHSPDEESIETHSEGIKDITILPPLTSTPDLEQAKEFTTVKRDKVQDTDQNVFDNLLRTVRKNTNDQKEQDQLKVFEENQNHKKTLNITNNNPEQ